jgi:rhodanese-related sulfurtransferase
MGASILLKMGFKEVQNLEGGSAAWIEAGLPVFEGMEGGIAKAAEPKKQMKLPERISAADLKRLMMDLPDTFVLVDIRPPNHYKDYHLPGSRNVDVAVILASQEFLVGAGPLIIVDRDGSIAMAVGGILSQKTERPVKVLYGGLEAYWSHSQGFMGEGSTAPTPASPSTPAIKPPAPKRPTTMPPPQKPAKPKKKSAGC